MYYDDHGSPHFHAYYGEFEAVVGIDPFEIHRGRAPKTGDIAHTGMDPCKLHGTQGKLG